MTEISPDRIVKIGYAYREAKALLSAVELGLFTALSGGPAPLEAVAGKIGIHRRGARDYLDSLVALGLLDRDDQGCYRNSAEASLYLDRGKPSYLGGELEFINAHLYRHWNELTKALRTGQPINPAATAVNSYRNRYKDPEEVERFARAMTAATRTLSTALAAKFPWRDYRTMIDIGSSQGCLPVEIARRHDHIRCGGFDLPPMAPVFEKYVSEHGLAGRVEFHPGDFFEDAFPAAEVIVVGRVLHNWDLPTKKMLLRKAFDALPAGGALIVYERLIDDARRSNAKAMLSSLNMLIMTTGGFDFTAADCTGWMSDAGFRNPAVQPLTSDQTMITGFK